MNALSILSAIVIGGGGAWSIGQIAIAIVVVAGIAALVFIALRQFGIQIPAWVAQVFWVLVVVVVIVLAIKFLMSL